MAYKRSITGLSSPKTAIRRALRLPQNSRPLAQGVWTALLSTVTCATVLGVPSMMTELRLGNLQGTIAQANPKLLAQTATPPVLPTSLPQGSKLAIDGSGSLAAMNQALKEKYEAKYKGTPVTFGTGGTAAGLQALEAGKVDLASIGRALTPDEIAKGFIAIPIKREKIAMLVSESNPFKGSLTIQQFAKIFRGEITNWNEVGGPDKPIRLIDQPDVSDTRNAFPNYPVFKSAPFQAVTSAVASGSENPEDVAAKLGDDGLGYITADGIKNLKGVRALDMHKTQPDDQRYPFSQPIAYVYKKGRLSPAAAAFLGYIGTEEAKAAIKSVSSPGAVIDDSAALIATAVAGATATATPAAVAVASPSSSPVAAVPNSAPASVAPIAAVSNGASDAAAAGFPWWPWLPIALAAAGLAWWLLKGRRGGAAGDAGAMGSANATGAPIGDAATVNPPAPTNPVGVTIDPGVAAAGAAIGTAAIGGAAAAVGTPERETDEPDTEIQSPNLAPIGGVVAGAAAVVAGAAAVAAAGQPIVEADPRNQAAAAIVSDLDDETLAIDHDVEVHGIGSAEVNPRGVQGEAGGLQFPGPDSAGLDPLAIAAGTAGLAGAVIAAGVTTGAATETIGSVPAVTLPHEPITQLPPDIHQPIGQGANPIDPSSPSSSDMPTNSPENTPAPQNPIDLGTAAGVAAGIAAGVATGIAIGKTPLSREDLADVDRDLPDLPAGYGESRIVLMARDPQWGYTYWDVPDDHRQALRNQGGQQLALRLYDVTDLDINSQNPHSLQQYSCDEMARDWYLPIPVSDREYLTEIGYLTATGGWLLLARSNTVRIPPVYPSDWMDDQFITVDFEENLQGRTFLQLVPPGTVTPPSRNEFNNPVFGVSQADQAARMAGSLFGSMHQIPAESLSSFVFPSGAGLWANEEFLGGEFWSLPTPSGMGMSGVGYTMSGRGMSGIGMGASMPPNRSRKFWLVADAELIIYGATEPDAQLTIGGVPVQLSADGTFRMQMSFQDGNLDFPIMAIAKDGEQMRQIRMTFDRSTPLRKTNTKDEAQDEQY